MAYICSLGIATCTWFVPPQKQGEAQPQMQSTTISFTDKVRKKVCEALNEGDQ